MRSAFPMSHNPWPHGMVIRIDDSPYALLELLWVRDAWALAVGADVPPLVDTPRRVDATRRARVDIGAWTRAWPGIWDAALAHAARPEDPSRFAAVGKTENASPERAAALRGIMGPTWHDRFGRDTLGEAFRGWHARHTERLIARRRAHTDVDEEPERACLASLVPAWHRGLTQVIVLPCRGEVTRSIGACTLLVTATTRDDAGRYATALTAFAPAAGGAASDANGY